jgi:hypothetical protein
VPKTTRLGHDSEGGMEERLTAGVSDLDTSLADVDRDDFTHCSDKERLTCRSKTIGEQKGLAVGSAETYLVEDEGRGRDDWLGVVGTRLLNVLARFSHAYGLLCFRSH